MNKNLMSRAGNLSSWLFIANFSLGFVNIFVTYFIEIFFGFFCIANAKALQVFFQTFTTVIKGRARKTVRKKEKRSTLRLPSPHLDPQSFLSDIFECPLIAKEHRRLMLQSLKRREKIQKSRIFFLFLFRQG